MIKLAAETFEIVPRTGSEGRTIMRNRAFRVFTPLKSSVVLISDGKQVVVLLTSHFMTHQYRLTNLLRRAVGEAMDVPREQVLCFSSHNHCVVKLLEHQYAFGVDESGLYLSDEELTWEGRQLLEMYRDTAARLRSQMKEVSVFVGRGCERRITHNRKGRRADGSTFLMREEDRRLYGADFTGDIDPEVFVLGFYDRDRAPVAMITQFTGHPVTAFHCDKPVVHGEYPQVACDVLSRALGGTPVAFLQGCAGDTNSKGLLSPDPVEVNVASAELYGRQLGETLVKTAGSLQEVTSKDLRLLWRPVFLPFRGVPPRQELERRLSEAEAFLARCGAGESETTRWCDGLNFPGNMTVPYRAALIRPIRDWLQWALTFHTENRLHEAPAGISLQMAVLRIGEVAIVGMPCEPLLGIGRQIKEQSCLSFTVPCGYMNDTSVAYVPDAPNCDDLDYVSAFYRYTTTMLPYRRPAGNLLARAAVKTIAESLKS